MPLSCLLAIAPVGQTSDALAAEAAEVRRQRIVERGGDLRFEPALGEVDGVGDLDLRADAHALAAEDALVHVPLDHRVVALDGELALVALERARLDAVAVAVVLQRARARLLAGDAALRVVGEEQVEDQRTRLDDCLRLGLEHHAVEQFRGARRHEVGPALHLDHAEPAGRGRAQRLVVTQGRDVDAQAARGLEDGRASRHRDFTAVDGRLDGRRLCACRSGHAASVRLLHCCVVGRSHGGPSLHCGAARTVRVRVAASTDGPPRRAGREVRVYNDGARLRKPGAGACERAAARGALLRAGRLRLLEPALRLRTRPARPGRGCRAACPLP